MPVTLSLDYKVGKLFQEEPDSKYFRICGPIGKIEDVM